MKNKVIILSILLIFLVIPIISADQIGINYGDYFADIYDWEEIIKIGDNNLNVTLAMSIKVSNEERIKEKFEYLELFIEPELSRGRTDVIFSNWQACSTYNNHAWSYTKISDSIRLENCITNLTNNVTSSGNNIFFKINLSNMDQDTRYIVFKTDYLIPANILDKSAEKTLVWFPECNFGDNPAISCPNPSDMDLHFLLPKEASIISIEPKATRLELINKEQWLIIFRNISAKEQPERKYEYIIIQYKDNNQIFWENLKENLVYGIFVTFILGFIFNKLWFSRKKISTYISDIKNHFK